MLKIVISGVVNACKDSAVAKELKELVDSIRDYEMSDEERREQRVSFVYGNSKLNGNGTKEQAKRAVESNTVPRQTP